MPIIKGIQKTTFVDFPGKIAATVFTAGCNFRCGFCHNTMLVDQQSGEALPVIPNDELLEYFAGRTNQLEGICISGGEPTIHKDLPAFIKKLKALGYLIKLDTNGTNPTMVAQLIQDKLLDYIAMDIKGPIELYPKIVNAVIDEAAILKSIDLIINSGVAHEFRTTVVPGFNSESDIEHVGCMVRGAQHYYLQQFHPCENVLDPALREHAPYADFELREFAKKFEPFVQKVTVRGAV